MKKNQPLQHLNGLTAAAFLRDYWQKKPLLIRRAFTDFAAPLTKAEVIELAGREEAESRMVSQRNGKWSLAHGPFSAKDFRHAAKAKWTVLIQDTQHFSHEAHDLLAKFNFIPAARVDDLMVSLAGDGGGVGPHVDSYDVFLLQGIGSRRWQISRQKDLALERNVPLKILAKFVPEQEWVLEEGDMLYLPPHIAHHGVALGDGKGKGECMTWSIGFRAPNKQELATAFLDFLRDDLALSGAYADRNLEVARTPGLIDAAMERRFAAMLDDVRHAVIDRKVLRRFLGCYLSDPKAHVMFDAPERTLAPAAFARLAKARGLRLDLKTRAFFLGPQLFVNGQATALPPAERAAWKSLTDTRSVAPAALQRVPADPAAPLYASYRAGYLHVQF